MFADFTAPEFELNLPPLPTEVIEGLPIVLIIGGAIAYVYYYAKALSLVQTGELIVYRDWGDFCKSALWVIALPLGLGWMLDREEPKTILGVLAGLVGLASLVQTWAGAFRYNCGRKRWLALFARFAVLLLLLFALAKLNERRESYKRGEYGWGLVGYARGVLIPLAIFAWVFNSLVRPMVGTRYYRARRLSGW